jgi:hypothetical protein
MKDSVMNISSRRVFLKYMAMLGLITWSTTPLYAKVPKATFKYQDTPMDGKKCINCTYFIPETNECKMVEGAISPEGWCRIFVQKK